MKVGNKLLNRMVAVGLLAVVLFCTFSLSKPEIAQAATFSYTFHNWDYDLQKVTDYTRSMNPTGAKNAKMYVATRTDSDATYLFLVAEDNPFGLSYTDIDNGKNLGTKEKTSCDGSTSVNGTTYYYMLFGSSGYHTSNSHNSYTWAGASKVYSYDPSVNLSWSDWVYYFVTGKKPNNVFEMDISCNTSDASKWQGSRENPIEDSNIGTLLLDRSKCYWTEGGEQPTVQRISWKNKTDTGFSLNNNKYALTRIEVKIGNRVTYFGDVEHHGTGKEVDNFGKVYPFKYVNPKNNPYDFSFTEMLTASQTDLEKYNPAMLEHEYDLYFRVICSDAIGTSAKYYVGKWTRYRCTDDPKQKGDNESDDGHFNENGEWEKDKDTDVDSGGIGNVKDEDEKNDDFNNFTDSENWKDWLNEGGLDLDSAKAFISQIAEVPKMIGDIFSFLPKWVLYSFALGFGLIPVVIVIKFLRG